jgi:hypothetical protein
VRQIAHGDGATRRGDLDRFDPLPDDAALQDIADDFQFREFRQRKIALLSLTGKWYADYTDKADHADFQETSVNSVLSVYKIRPELDAPERFITARLQTPPPPTLQSRL